MKTYKVLAALFAVLALIAAAAGVIISLGNINTEPVLAETPEEARQRAVALMDAVCAGDYEGIRAQLYGQPELGLDREPEDTVGKLFWQALMESRSYTIVRDCYATDDGIAMDVILESLDMDSVTGNLRNRAQSLLEQRVAQAEDSTEIYREGGEYREEFVMAVLEDAAQEALQEDAANTQWHLTLRFVYDEGRWWIRPDEEVLAAISGDTIK